MTTKDCLATIGYVTRIPTFPLLYPMFYVLCPMSLSGSSEPLSVFINTLELSHFHFDSNYILRISDISEVYFNISSKSLTIPAKRLTGFLI